MLSKEKNTLLPQPLNLVHIISSLRHHFSTKLSTVAPLGNLGGTFGLFLGMSFLTLLEFFDFVFQKNQDFRRILHLFKATKNKKSLASDR